LEDFEIRTTFFPNFANLSLNTAGLPFYTMSMVSMPELNPENLPVEESFETL